MNRHQFLERNAAIESVRTALAMRDAGYGAVPSAEHVAELLFAYYDLKRPQPTPDWRQFCATGEELG